jgi:hypothetical protein
MTDKTSEMPTFFVCRSYEATTKALKTNIKEETKKKAEAKKKKKKKKKIAAGKHRYLKFGQ